MNVLVDTSVWSLALRRKGQNLDASEKEIVAELEELIAEGRARIVGVVRQEILSGLKDHSQFVRLRSALRAFADEALSEDDYEAAAAASNACRARGLAISTIDLLLCAVADLRGWALFSVDPDFKRYANVIPVKLHATRKPRNR